MTGTATRAPDGPTTLREGLRRIQGSLPRADPVIAAVMALALMVAALAAFRRLDVAELGLGVFLVLLSVGLALWAADDRDRAVLPFLIPAALTAKLLAAWARLAIVDSLYGGPQDAAGYHRRGLRLREMWRALDVPTLADAGFGSAGTRMTSIITGLVYVPFKPTIMQGFLLFALLGFLGQLLFYLGARRHLTGRSLTAFRLLIFFWPSMLFWTGSVGKDAIVGLGLGLAFYGVARAHAGLRISGLIAATAGLALVFSIRAHVAALFVVALIGALALTGGSPKTRVARWIAAGAVAAVALLFAPTILARLPVGDGSVDSATLEAGFTEIGRRTNQGSVSTIGPVTGPADILPAAIKVLYEPLPYSARSAQQLAASVEGTILFVITLWRLPAVLRNWRRIARSPLLLMALLYVGGFVYAWSAIYNLGILTRQRAMALPFLFLLLAGAGWTSRAGGQAPRERRALSNASA